MKRIIRFMLAFAAIICLGSCGGGNNNNSRIDELQTSRKQWERNSYGNLSLCSDNYYVSDKGENVYGILNFVETDYGKVSGFGFYVIGADENQAKTTIRFDNRQSSFMVSFNNGEYIQWPFLAQPKETAAVGYYNEWENHIRESETCEIRFKAEDAQMDFRFNTKGFPW